MNADMDLLTAAHQKDRIATRSVFIITSVVTSAVSVFNDHFLSLIHI